MSERRTLGQFDPTKIDTIFAALDRCDLPGAAVGISIDGVPVYRKGFGRASLELPVLLGPSTRMRIGSTSKHMTALAFMLLCEEGRAAIDDPVGRYLPELNGASRHVSMRHLMGHTSGIRDVVQISIFMHGMDARISDAEMLDFYRTIDDVDFAPGESWSYNNGGYMLLSAVIERITGRSLDEVLSRRIFQPVGMYDTRLQRWDSEFLPDGAALHMSDGNGGYRKGSMGMELTGAGGVVSTVDDMLRWLRHMNAPVVGSAATWDLIRTPQGLANGSLTGYGLGLMADRYRGADTVAHAGGVVGGNSQMIKVLPAKLDISVAVNRSDAVSIDLANRIIDECVGGLAPAAGAQNAIVQPGTYLSKATGRVIRLSVTGGASFVSVDAGMPMQIVRHQDGVWRLVSVFSMFKRAFRIDETSVRFCDFGNEDVLERVGPPGKASLGSRAGNYRCEPLGASARLFEEGEGASLEMRGRYGQAQYDLSPVTSRVWCATSRRSFFPVAGIVTFVDDCKGFLLTNDRMRRLRFRRAGTQS